MMSLLSLCLSLSVTSSSERSSYCNYVWTEQDGLSVSVGVRSHCLQRVGWKKVRTNFDVCIGSLVLDIKKLSLGSLVCL